MSDGFRMLPVAYPDGALDITACRDDLSKGADGAVGRAHDLLRALETGGNPILVLTAGSPEYESLMSRDGMFRLVAGSWYHNSAKAHPGVLAARFPYLAEYLRTRTEGYIAYQRHELQFISSEHDRLSIESDLQALTQQLAEF